jgi:hypothetical protein
MGKNRTEWRERDKVFRKRIKEMKKEGNICLMQKGEKRKTEITG